MFKFNLRDKYLEDTLYLQKDESIIPKKSGDWVLYFGGCWFALSIDKKTGRVLNYEGYSSYFYPKDNTPGCTAQACSLRDGYNDLRKAGYEIVGVSVDSEKSHQRFIDKFSLPFPLIADTDKKLVEEFGVWQEKSMMGKKFMGTVRTTFLIDENGIIRDKIEGRGVDTKNHAAQILEKMGTGRG